MVAGKDKILSMETIDKEEKGVDAKNVMGKSRECSVQKQGSDSLENEPPGPVSPKTKKGKIKNPSKGSTTISPPKFPAEAQSPADVSETCNNEDANHENFVEVSPSPTILQFRKLVMVDEKEPMENKKSKKKEKKVKALARSGTTSSPHLNHV